MTSINMVSSKRPWWVEYRQQQRRKAMSLEMIVRRSFGEALREYVDNCSISGIQLICDSKITWTQRMFRICVICFMICLLWYLLYYVWLNTLAKPLIVSTESTAYPIGEIDFPAVSLCNVNRISKKALQNFTKILQSAQPEFRNVSLEELEQFVLQVGRLLDFSFDSKWGMGNAFLKATSKRRYDDINVVGSMEMLAPKCEEMLLRCSWAGKFMPCEDLFAVRRTARGHCCTFNYILDYDSAESPHGTIAVAKRQRLQGYLHGLAVALDPMLDDYAYPITSYRGFDVLIYNPTHFADLSAGGLLHRLAEAGQAEFIQLKSTKQVASSEVRKYPLNVRKCLFKDELPEEFNGMYSYSACIVRCRIRAIQSLCKCTPYFLPAGNTKARICNLNDLMCLNKYKEKLVYLYPINAEKTEGLEIEMEESLYCSDCMPDCELTKHQTKCNKAPMSRHTLLEAYFVDEFMEGIHTPNVTYLAIYQAGSDGLLDRLDVIAYWFEILSSVGGYGGVILGLSVFSVIEIIYFLIFRFIKLLRNNYTNYH